VNWYRAFAVILVFIAVTLFEFPASVSGLCSQPGLENAFDGADMVVIAQKKGTCVNLPTPKPAPSISAKTELPPNVASLEGADPSLHDTFRGPSCLQSVDVLETLKGSAVRHLDVKFSDTGIICLYEEGMKSDSAYLLYLYRDPDGHHMAHVGNCTRSGTGAKVQPDIVWLRERKRTKDAKAAWKAVEQAYRQTKDRPTKQRYANLLREYPEFETGLSKETSQFVKDYYSLAYGSLSQNTADTPTSGPSTPKAPADRADTPATNTPLLSPKDFQR
jgi:hypothetical protein